MQTHQETHEYVAVSEDFLWTLIIVICFFGYVNGTLSNKRKIVITTQRKIQKFFLYSLSGFKWFRSCVENSIISSFFHKKTVTFNNILHLLENYQSATRILIFQFKYR